MSVAYPKTRFRDNVIPLKGGLFGPQLAGWTPRSAVHERMGCRLYADQMIPVEDSIALAADVYTPKKPGRYPAIIAYSAYCTQLQSTGAPTGTNETGSPPVFTDRGYAHVIVARRGMGRSQGESTAYFNDQDVEDHAKVIAWAAAQPWCDGQVVLFGTSYYGIVQPQVATLQPPALKGFFSIEMCTDYFRHIVMFGGAPQNDFLALWNGANFTDFQFKLRVPPFTRALMSLAPQEMVVARDQEANGCHHEGIPEEHADACHAPLLRPYGVGREDARDDADAARPVRQPRQDQGAVRRRPEPRASQSTPVRRL
jgi:uncharacterized protein